MKLKIQNRHLFFGFIVLVVVILLVFISYRGEPKFPRRKLQEGFTTEVAVAPSQGTEETIQEVDLERDVKAEINQSLEDSPTVQLITNGSFELGENIKELAEQQGGNAIITMSNPGSSSNVLRQTQVNPETKKQFKNTFYMIQVNNLLANRSYYIQCYAYQTPDWNGKDYLFNVLMQPNNFSYQRAELSSGDGEIIGQKRLANNITWNQVRFNFKTPSDFNGTVQIYLGYKPENTSGERYITNIEMFQYLANARNFPVSEGLQVFLSGVNCNSYNEIGTAWKDLSDNSNDFYWNIKPRFHAVTGQFIMEAYNATGPHGFRLIHPTDENRNRISKYENEFTLIIDPMMQSLTTTVATNITPPTIKRSQLNSQVQVFLQNARNPNNIVITEDDNLVVLFQGNSNIGLAIFWPKNNGGKIKLVIADQLYETQNSINPTNNLLYTFMYTGTNFIIFEESSIIFNEAVQPIYFKQKPVKINPLETFQGLLRYFIFYNRVLLLSEIMKVKDYFHKYQQVTDEECSTDVRPSMTSYTLSTPPNVTSSDTSSDTSNDMKGTNGGTTPKPTASDCSGLTSKLEAIKRAVDLRVGNIKLSEVDMAKIQKEEEDKVLTSFDRSCIAQQTNSQDNISPYDTTLGPNCPRIFFTNNQYVIRVVKGSDLEKKYGRSGEVILGKDLDTAQKVYAINHPSCVKQPVPTNNNGKKDGSYCPFIIQRDYNPCMCSSCQGVDWSKDPRTQFIPDNCKRSVRNYCEAYADVEGGKDQACYYWGEGRDLPEAREFRNYFGEMASCKFNDADISRHPDSDKYIRKDIVSSVCSSCPLDSYDKPADPRNAILSSVKNLVNLPF